MSIRIAIIGGGPAGVSTFLHLKDKLEPSVFAPHIEFFIFEKNKELGQGLPYASLNNAHLVNLSKIIMEPMAEDYHSFAKWLADTDSTTRTSLFPPRHYFGKYLAFRANQAKLACEKKGMKINFHRSCPVLSIQQITDELFEVLTKNEKYLVNYVILSTGHMPAANFSQLTNKPGYFSNPWSRQSYELIQPESSICIIGSRLTAIDVALRLHTIASKGKIEMVSRGGLLPAVKGKPSAYSPQYLTMNKVKQLTKESGTPLKLDLLLDLFWQELKVGVNCSQSKLQAYLNRELSALDWLSCEIQAVQSSPRIWQAILAHFYQLLSKLWPQLSMLDRGQFLTQYFSLFATYNCAFPIESAVSLREMLISGQLEVHSGFRGIHFEDNQFVIHLNKKIIKSTFVFNATGCGHDPEQIPLLKSMLDNKLITKYSLGGINAEPSTLRIIDAKGVVHPRIYALGDVVGGVCFYTLEITHLVSQAKQLTESFYEHLVSTLEPVVLQ